MENNNKEVIELLTKLLENIEKINYNIFNIAKNTNPIKEAINKKERRDAIMNTSINTARLSKGYKEKLLSVDNIDLEDYNI